MGAFTDYRNKVKYDYIFDIFIKENPSFKDKVDDIQKLLNNEDFLNIYFPEPGLGRVYIDVYYNSFIKQIVFRFGISKDDKKEDFDSKILLNDIIECLLSLNKNIELYGTEDQITKEDIKYNIVKNSKKEESYDSKLVNFGQLDFISDMLESLVLTNEGKVEYYINNGLYETFDFSKQRVNELSEKLIKQGAVLKEATDSDKIDNQNINIDLDIDSTEAELKQGIEDVNKLQALKDELMTKVDHLVNEGKEDIFPSSNKTDKLLTLQELEEKGLESYLNEEQINWIEKYITDLKEFENKFIELFELVNPGKTEPLISINQYIKEIMKGDIKND